MSLRLRRRADVVLPSVWQVVSGKIEADERIAHAFARQVQAKTGRRASTLFKLPYVNTFYDEHHDTVMFVPCAGCSLDGDDVEIDATLHVAFQWAGIVDARDLLRWPGQHECLRLIEDVASGRSGADLIEPY